MVRTGIETSGAGDFYEQSPGDQAAAEAAERAFVDPANEADATAVEALLRQNEFLGDPDPLDPRGEIPGPQDPKGDQR